MSQTNESPNLRRGWTTGTCAAAAARAAYQALLTGEFPDPVSVLLPGGARPAFALALQERGIDFARAGIVKDAGDDPDVTHGAVIISTVRLGQPGSGVQFQAGAGGGEKIAERTLNGRLGIVGGLSILGTTGIVVPYSCAAWIHSIYRGIDVARAMGLDHVAGSTGATSEVAVQKLHALHEVALIDMGDFVGGMLKYLRRNPVERVTIAGGMGKMTKLGQGLLDLHSRRGDVDLNWLATMIVKASGASELAERVRDANTAKEAFEIAGAAGIDVGGQVAEAAWATAANVLRNSDIALETVIFDRTGQLLARTPFRKVHSGTSALDPSRNRRR